MNPAVLELVHALHAAMQARKVYGEDHATWKACVRSARESAARACGDEGEARLVALGERLLWNDETVDPDAGPAPIARALTNAGLAWITISAKVDEEQLAALARACAEGGDLAAALAPLRDIRAGVAVAGSAPVTAGEAFAPAIALDAMDADVASALGAALTDPDAAAEQLVGVVDRIAAVVASARTAMLPLAAVKSHDEYTYVHTVNVGIMSAALAEAVGLRPDQTHDLMLGALLHDVGKQLVPAEVLNKNGKLSDAELALMKRHPTDGARILLDAGDLPEVVPIIAFEHHLRLDGRGYPSVPNSWRPNLASLIVHVADVFDALRTNRPYRPAMGTPEACHAMYQDADTSFDRALLDAFFERVVVKSARDAGPSGFKAAA